jgi:hypothetical protein
MQNRKGPNPEDIDNQQLKALEAQLAKLEADHKKAIAPLNAQIKILIDRHNARENDKLMARLKREAEHTQLLMKQAEENNRRIEAEKKAEEHKIYIMNLPFRTRTCDPEQLLTFPETLTAKYNTDLLDGYTFNLAPCPTCARLGLKLYGKIEAPEEDTVGYILHNTQAIEVDEELLLALGLTLDPDDTTKKMIHVDDLPDGYTFVFVDDFRLSLCPSANEHVRQYIRQILFSDDPDGDDPRTLTDEEERLLFNFGRSHYPSRSMCSCRGWIRTCVVCKNTKKYMSHSTTFGTHVTLCSPVQRDCWRMFYPTSAGLGGEKFDEAGGCDCNKDTYDGYGYYYLSS